MLAIDDFTMGYGSIASYRQYLNKRVAALCAEHRSGQVQAHQCPIPYQDISKDASADLAQGMNHRLSWRSLSGQKAMCRVRLGLLRLSHLNGKDSDARYTHCIFCDQRLLSPYLHTFASCAYWVNQRTRVWQQASTPQPQSKRDALLGVVRSRPGMRQYDACIAWITEISSAEQKFWQESTRPRSRISAQVR